ncbi:MAG: hypothetical protein WC307_06280 [Candidatus Nanoarchaeia archaeon]|jgi:hypothetical protein
MEILKWVNNKKRKQKSLEFFEGVNAGLTQALNQRDSGIRAHTVSEGAPIPTWIELDHAATNNDIHNLYISGTIEGVTQTIPERPLRKSVKPVDVVNELHDTKLRISLANIDEKIKLLNKRLACMVELKVTSGKTEVLQAIKWLENRKKLRKYYKEFIWHATNDDIIDKLCDKYKLTTGSVQSYHRVIPTEALDVIAKYTKLFKKIELKNEPEFRLVMEDEEKIKDPVLLARSPFGNFWFVLGAWDKEVKIMKEFYGDKY